MSKTKVKPLLDTSGRGPYIVNPLRMGLRALLSDPQEQQEIATNLSNWKKNGSQATYYPKK